LFTERKTSNKIKFEKLHNYIGMQVEVVIETKILFADYDKGTIRF